jgi:transposase
MPYSMDFRERVIAACDRGMATSVVARLFLVSPSWVRRLKQRRRETGSIAPRVCPSGPPPRIGPGLHPFIHEHFRKQPGTTLPQLARALEAHTGQTYGLTTVRRAAHRLRYRLKKSPLSPPSRHAPISRRNA